MTEERRKDFGSYQCDTCLDHGYRVHTKDGRSFNAASAKANGIQGEKRTCQSCGGKSKPGPKPSQDDGDAKP